MTDKREKVYKFRVNEEESKWIEDKIKLSTCKTKSDFFRKMIMYGIVIKYNEEEMKNIFRLMNSVTNNLNQIYFKLKENNDPLLAEVEILKSEVEESWQLLKSIQSILRKLKP